LPSEGSRIEDKRGLYLKKDENDSFHNEANMSKEEKKVYEDGFKGK
jgi:hypothetical protein